MVDPDTGIRIIDKVIHLQQEGWIIILWTCRTGERLQEAVDWCKERGLVFNYVNENTPQIKKLFKGDNRKIFANIYLDDRALNVKDF